MGKLEADISAERLVSFVSKQCRDLPFGTDFFRNIACIGAWLTIVSLAASPITQQTITYPQRSVLANGTGIAYQLLNFADPLFQTNLSAYGYDSTDVDSEGDVPVNTSE